MALQPATVSSSAFSIMPKRLVRTGASAGEVQDIPPEPGGAVFAVPKPVDRARHPIVTISRAERPARRRIGKPDGAVAGPKASPGRRSCSSADEGAWGMVPSQSGKTSTR